MKNAQSIIVKIPVRQSIAQVYMKKRKVNTKENMKRERWREIEKG
jgi:MinD superfamily P-loop ATPase